jgi:hypothetical protein
MELPKFRSNIFWEFIWFPKMEKACFQAGYNSEPITFLLRTGFNVIECYKTLIKTFTQWDNWDFNRMRTKGFFDSCRASTSSTPQLFRWDFFGDTAANDKMWTPEIEFTLSEPYAIDITN